MHRLMAGCTIVVIVTPVIVIVSSANTTTEKLISLKNFPKTGRTHKGVRAVTCKMSIADTGPRLQTVAGRILTGDGRRQRGILKGSIEDFVS